MKLLPTLTLLGLVASSIGAPQLSSLSTLMNLASRFLSSQNSLSSASNFNNFNSPNNNIQNRFQPNQIGRAINNPIQPIQNVQAVPPPGFNPPLGLTVDFDSSFGSFPLGSQNELTPAQRNVLLPVMESLEKVMETDKPNARDVNTLMIQVRDLVKLVPEGQDLNLRQWGFDTDALGVDLRTLKNIALPETGDIVITENGQDKIVTTFGTFPLESLMTKAETEQFLPAVKAFINILKKDVLSQSETREVLEQTRKLDSWNLFPFEIRENNQPRQKSRSGTTFNMGALGLIGGLINSQQSENFV